MSNICAPTFISCPAESIRLWLTKFYSECSADLLGNSGSGADGNAGVLNIYDVLYLILPLKEALCSKSAGQYCVNLMSSPSSTTPASSGAVSSSAADPAASSSGSESSSASAASSSGSSASASASASSSVSGSASSSASAPSASASHPAKRELVARQSTNTTQTTLTNGPNAAEYRSTNLPYLFINPNATDFCTNECTSKVMGAYIRFETVTPYAIGIANSPILKGQLDLWNRLKDCPNGLAQSLLNNYTTNGNTSVGGAAKAAAGVGSALVAVFAAVGAAVLL